MCASSSWGTCEELYRLCGGCEELWGYVGHVRNCGAYVGAVRTACGLMWRTCKEL